MAATLTAAVRTAIGTDAQLADMDMGTLTALYLQYRTQLPLGAGKSTLRRLLAGIRNTAAPTTPPVQDTAPAAPQQATPAPTPPAPPAKQGKGKPDTTPATSKATPDAVDGSHTRGTKLPAPTPEQVAAVTDAVLDGNGVAQCYVRNAQGAFAPASPAQCFAAGFSRAATADELHTLGDVAGAILEARKDALKAAAPAPKQAAPATAPAAPAPQAKPNTPPAAPQGKTAPTGKPVLHTVQDAILIGTLGALKAACGLAGVTVGDYGCGKTMRTALAAWVDGQLKGTAAPSAAAQTVKADAPAPKTDAPATKPAPATDKLPGTYAELNKLGVGVNDIAARLKVTIPDGANFGTRCGLVWAAIKAASPKANATAPKANTPAPAPTYPAGTLMVADGKGGWRVPSEADLLRAIDALTGKAAA